MEFGKRHDTTDTTDFCPRRLNCYGLVDVADLLLGSRQLVTNLLYGETWCKGFWPLACLYRQNTTCT